MVVLHEVPLRWPALKKVIPRCSDEPQNHVDQVCPPGIFKPELVDEKKASIEVKESKLDEGERRSG